MTIVDIRFCKSTDSENLLIQLQENSSRYVQRPPSESKTVPFETVDACSPSSRQANDKASVKDHLKDDDVDDDVVRGLNSISRKAKGLKRKDECFADLV